jgi:hypothetical protein
VNALVFFGTPHQGANIADWTKYLGKISRVIGIRSSTVTAELGLWSKPILDLNNLFTEQAADQNVSTFWEMEKYLGVQVCQPILYQWAKTLICICSRLWMKDQPEWVM